MDAGLIAPQWLAATNGEEVDWHDDSHRLHLLASILLKQRSKHPPINSGTKVRVFEIISDNIRDNKPLWHGLNADAKLFRQEEIDSLSQRLETKRKDIGGYLNTHFGMGELFYRPVLLGVHQSPGHEVKCYAHTSLCWEEVQHARHLPLKVRRSGQEKENLAIEIAEHLSLLHTHVLWPAFFTGMGVPKPRQSLVLIHASSWRVLGVWALHAEGADLIEPQQQKESDLLSTVLHPMAAINDVFGAMINLSPPFTMPPPTTSDAMNY